MPVTKLNRYPDYSAELEEIERNGITTELVNRIVERHQLNAYHTKHLWGRYNTLDVDVPIYSRTPRFNAENPINNKLANDFYGEIVDVEVGYFAGKPFSYNYSKTNESEEETGSEQAVEVAYKTLSDFITLNNMYDHDMTMTKYATAAEYAGRLFYIDEEGKERVKILPPYETIILYKNDMTEPSYAIRYYTYIDLTDTEIVKAEFYDDKYIIEYEGYIGGLRQVSEPRLHLFDYCPLQGIPKNNELLGSAEKVTSLIDAYDKILSDSTNEIESFANAYMIFENVNMTEDDMRQAQATGAIKFFNGTGSGKVYFLTKDVNDSFIENKLDRLENNIYRFSKTPNLSNPNERYGDASGVSLKFRLIGLETKCSMFEAKVNSAAVYMFKLLASSWRKKRISFDPLQCYITCKRNFPADLAGEAQTAAALLSAGLPKRIVWETLSCVDDIDFALEVLREEKDDIPDLDMSIPEDEENNENNKNEKKEEENTKRTETL